ncbi:carboxymuconolactone decarboxylase family protein [Gordonia terrae]
MAPGRDVTPTGVGHERSGGESAGYERGLEIRRSVMGEEFVGRALARASGTESEHVQHFVTEHVWGAQWARPGLDRRSRSLATISILVALRAHEELTGHLRAAMTNGLTPDEITEVIVHSVGYCGAPAAMSAMRVAQDVFDSSAG